MELMTLDEMLFYKQLAGLSYIEIAERSGVPLSTVQKVFSLNTVTPRHKTLEQLGKAFEEFSKEKWILADSAYERAFYNDVNRKKQEKIKKKREESSPANTDDLESTSTNLVNEGIDEQISAGGSSALDLSSYENKTIDDYLALPEGTRVELIDGVFYDMGAPNYIHNKIAYYMCRFLDDFIDTNNGKCRTNLAPYDVQLDCDEKTMIQPDLLVICDEKRDIRTRVVGAPDFVVEIVSESSIYTDVFRKRMKYQQAGVREYWIVFPKEKEIQVYFFEASDLPTKYTFEDAVPVNIWDGKCKVDFKYICNRLSDYMS